MQERRHTEDLQVGLEALKKEKEQLEAKNGWLAEEIICARTVSKVCFVLL